MCSMAIYAFGTQIEAHGTEFEVFARTYLLLYHFFHSLLCTIDVLMYTVGEVVFYRQSDGTLVPATMLGPGARSETVQIEYKCNERLAKHPAASIANSNFFFHGTGLLMAVHKNSPLVPRHFLVGK